MWVLFSCLAGGVILGWQRWLPARILALSSKGMTLSVMVLLLSMGIRLGADRETLSQLGNYGLQALIFAAGSVAASLALVLSLEFLLARRRTSLSEQGSNGAQAHPYRMTVLILSAFGIGVILGRFVFPGVRTEHLSIATMIALNFTLVTVGLDLGLNKEIWHQIARLGWQVFLAPAGVALGSVAAGMAIGKVLGWSWLEGGAVGAGFGWYSLSGVLITQIHSVSLGTIAFLSNVVRELLAIILIPWLSRRVGMLALVAPGGATTMDTTLPLLAAVGPPGMAVVALVNGICLSALVPIIVPLLLG